MATQQDINFIRLVEAGLWGAALNSSAGGSATTLPVPAAYLLGGPVGTTVGQGVTILATAQANSPLPGGLVLDDIDGSYSTINVDIDGSNSPLYAS